MKRKIVSCIAAVLTVCICFADISVLAAGINENGSEASGQNTVLYGDVNSDGVINYADVELLARYLSDDVTATIHEAASDVDRNGIVNLNDLLYLVQYIKGSGDIALGQTVTVSFETYGGETIDPVTIVTGGTFSAPAAVKENAVFLGWFKDPDFENAFYSSDPILEDLTVYAKYQEIESTVEYMPSAYALQNQSPDLTFVVERTSGDALPKDAVKVISVDGSSVPELIFVESGTNRWTVRARNGYCLGASYQMKLADGYKFAEKDKNIRTASFYIYQDEVVSFPLNNDIIYIRDTAEMRYTLSDGTICDILDSAVIYNEENTISGTFSYPEASSFKVDDTLCIYQNTTPAERDYVNGDYSDDATAYIVVTAINGDTVSFRGMSMVGEESDINKLISMPSTLPFSVLNLPEGNGTISFDSCDIAALYSMYGVSAPTEAKVGDFIVFYIGSFGSLREGDPVLYKKITEINGSNLTYVASTQEELLEAVNLFLSDQVDGDTMLENVDTGELTNLVLKQVESSGFAEDAVEYLSRVALGSDELFGYLEDYSIVVYDKNGVMLTEDQLRAYGAGHSFQLVDTDDKSVSIGFNITACDGENSHFEQGLKLTLTIGAEFEVDVGKDGKMGSLKIELSASFTQEVMLDVSIKANADVTWYLFIPVINDIVFSSAVDAMSYTGVSIEAKFYTQEPSEDLIDKIKENWGDKLGKENIKKIEDFIKEYEDQFGNGSFDDDANKFWEAQADLVASLITSGEISEDDVESLYESTNELNVVQDMFNNVGIMDDEEYNAGITELAERYADMLTEEDSGWLELCKLKMFENELHLFIFAIELKGSFVVRANINIALGANMEYEIGKRYVNWFSIFGKGSGSNEIDLIDERFEFQFYAMGYIGIKMGILLEVNVGIISTKIGSVGISAEFGVYASLYGYFEYTYTKYRVANTIEWEEEEKMIGALYFEFGLYLDIKLNAQLLSVLEKSWDLYYGEWALLSAGSRQNVNGFATEPKDDEVFVITDADGDNTNGILSALEESFRSMKTLDMKTGETDTPVYPWISYYNYNFWAGDDYSLTQNQDKINFTYSFSSKYFSLVPVYEERDGKQYLVDYTVRAEIPEGVHYLACELRLVWCLDKLCYSKYDIALTIPIVWTDLSDEELNEYKTATVKIGNATEGYRTVWTDRYLKGEIFDLPDEETILRIIKYAGDDDLKYSGYTGYTTSNRGPITSTENITLSFDTVYYFDIDMREYTIEVEDVQNPDGSTETRSYHAKFGETFDFSDLNTTGTEKNGTYTAFKSIAAFDSEGNALIRDVNEIISGNFASELRDGQITYRAQYQNNSGVVTYKFSGISLDPLHVVYKNGEMPTQNDFLEAIAGVDSMAYVKSILPALSKVDGDAEYTVTVSIPEKPLLKYTVSYELNGGSGESSARFTERGVITMPADPMRAGYTFKGWYYDSSFTQPMDWNRPMPAMDFTLYAKWDPNTYTISFDAGEGTSATASKDVFFDRMVGDLPTANRANYIFVGWFTSASDGVMYTEDTLYSINRSITLYAHWQLKTAISPSSLTFSDNAAVTYDGKTHKPTLNCDINRIDVGSFSIQYKRQTLDRNWTEKLPENAGTYDVRITRTEDDQYLAFDYVYTAVLSIKKASRTITNSGFTAIGFYANLMVTGIPDYVGEGTAMYAISTSSTAPEEGWQNTSGFVNLSKGNYNVFFFVSEGENYQNTNIVKINTPVTINGITTSVSGNEVTTGDFKAVRYELYSHTRDKALAGSGASWVFAKLNFADGTSGADVHITPTGVRNDTSINVISPAVDPWMISGLTYRLKGSDGWETDKEHAVTIYGNGTQTKYNVQTITFSLDDNASKTLDAGVLFKRKITGVGDFNSNVSLTLSENSGYFTYTYDGTVVDQYAPLSISGNQYNCYQHSDAPTLVVVCETPAVNGHDYQQYFRAGINTISIDRDSLYAAMIRDGVTSVHATATLSFPERSTVSGSTWTKNFTISLPESVTATENFKNGAVSTPGEVTVQTQEDELYISMTVNLGQNPGIWGIKNVISYDTSKLSLEGWSAGTLTSIYEMKFNDAEGRFTFVAYRDSTSCSYMAGSFVTLTFKKLVQGITVSELLTVETKEAINVKGENLSVRTDCEAGASTSVPPTDDNVYLIADEEITDAIFAALNNHSSAPLVLHYKTEMIVTAEMISAWFHAAKDQLNEYQQFGIQRYTADAIKYTKEGVYYYTLTYKIQYYTTTSQEAVFETKLDEMVSALNLNGKSDIYKILSVYDYICKHVTYDSSSDIGFSAYGALVNGKATCQGYSLLLMRMLERVGIEAHVVFGKTGEINHMWNTVKLNDIYYLLDSTWDSQSQTGCYFWFLKGSNSFDHHLAESVPVYTISAMDHPEALVYSHVFNDACDTKCNNCGYIRTVIHSYQTEWSKDSENHWHECSVCGGKADEAEHVFDNACDTTCNICGYTRSIMHSYRTEWSNDGTSHWHECSVCGDKNDNREHEYDNTCDTTCNICGYTRIITHNYQTEWSYDGSQHWHECSVCGDKTDNSEHIFDNSCDTTCNVCGYTRSITHDYLTEWSNDENRHWHECSVCGDKIDEAEHIYDNAFDTTCNICGYTRSIMHSYRTEWSNDGTYHWHECSVCGDKNDNGEHEYDNTCDTTCNICGYTRIITHNYQTEWSNDESQHWHECSVCGHNIDNAEHIFDNACDTTCSVCGYVRTITHDYQTEWSNDENQHWHECSVCGDKIDITAHIYDNACDTTCNVCGYTRIITHSYKSDWSQDRYCHWHECSVCGDKTDNAEHIFDNTCDTICNICGYTRIITHDYNTEWSNDGSQHWHECSVCGDKIDSTAHIYDNACDTTCNVCGYTRSITHDYQSVWSNDGSRHWHECSVCGDKTDNSEHIFDNSCETTCNVCGYTRIITHSYQTEWSNDGSQHWHECSVCGDKIDEAEHIYDNACDTTCNVCRYTRMITHNYQTEWSYDGSQHWHECSVCGDKTDNGEHIFDNSCDTTCNVCGYTRTITHSYQTEWSNDSTYHWHECSICGDRTDNTEHIFDNTCDATCNICGYTRAITHDHQTAWSNDVTYHWHECSVCGDKTDEATHVYDNACDTTCNVCDYVRVITHDYQIEWSNDSTYHWHECSVCGDKTDNSEHIFDNSCDTTCNICGYTRKITHDYQTAWSNDVTYHWQECSVCGDRTDNGEHVYDNACDTTCNVCGYIRTITHSYKSDWSQDGNCHWHECSICSCKSEISAHELEWMINKQATVTEVGTKHEECKICGYKKPGVDIEKLAPTITDGKEAKWNKGSKSGLIFRSDAAISDFVEVLVDGRVVAPENYDKREGSIIIELKASYVETLPEGNHVLTIRSTSGDANTDFSVESDIVNEISGSKCAWIFMVFAFAFIGVGAVIIAIVICKRKSHRLP